MQKEILITGGAGSLGRAFVKLLHAEHKITVIDNNEWAIAELSTSYPQVECRLGDFSEYRMSGIEDIVIHTAAYKHVDLAENNVESVIHNNLTKTIQFYHEVDRTLARVLYISTDKAVEPVSAYGASKYLAECLTRELGGSVARLGNLLESSGSVIPTWETQIKEKRPITITDERMTRYVIDVDSAAQQLWDQFMEGRLLCIPEMGEPIRILDLMAEVLKRHGYEKASDYTPGVQIIGMRKGEKLHEKLVWDKELV